MIALMRGWEWLTDDQRARIATAVPRTLAANASRSELGASWHGVVADRDNPVSSSSNVQQRQRPSLYRYHHGAPGMVMAFADAPFRSLALDGLLLEGDNFVWAAGPLAKGSNLCHGTGGNGYALLQALSPN